MRLLARWVLHAVAPVLGQTWDDVLITDSRAGLRIPHHALKSEAPTVVTGLRFERVQHPVYCQDTGKPLLIDLIEPLVDGRDMEPADITIEAFDTGGGMRVQRRDGTAFQITADGFATIHIRTLRVIYSFLGRMFHIAVTSLSRHTLPQPCVETGRRFT